MIPPGACHSLGFLLTLQVPEPCNLGLLDIPIYGTNSGLFHSQSLRVENEHSHTCYLKVKLKMGSKLETRRQGEEEFTILGMAPAQAEAPPREKAQTPCTFVAFLAAGDEGWCAPEWWVTGYPSEPPDTLCPDSDVHTVSSPPGQQGTTQECVLQTSCQRFGIALDTDFLVLLYTELLMALQIFTLDKDNYKPGFPQSLPRIEHVR